jgi:hypothetical protein
MLRVKYLVMYQVSRHAARVAASRNLQNIEDKLADHPAETFDALADHRVASVELPWLETTQYARCFVQRCTTHYVILVLIVWSLQGRFLRNKRCSIYTVCF